jgi:hypothetical protein
MAAARARGAAAGGGADGWDSGARGLCGKGSGRDVKSRFPALRAARSRLGFAAQRARQRLSPAHARRAASRREKARSAHGAARQL